MLRVSCRKAYLPPPERAASRVSGAATRSTSVAPFVLINLLSTGERAQKFIADSVGIGSPSRLRERTGPNDIEETEGYAHTY